MLLDCSIIDLKLAERRANGPSPIIAEQKGATMVKRICEIETCDKLVHSKKTGYCSSHHKKFIKRGDPSWQRPKLDRRCGIYGCERKHEARGLCSKHYQAHKKSGRVKLKPIKRLRVCGVDGCNKKYSNRGYCKSHARRDRLYGDPLGGRLSHNAHRTTNKDKITFLKSLKDTQLDRCIDWPYSKWAGGYGRVRFNGRDMGAHRASLMINVGDPPDKNSMALHKPIFCHNTSCVNPNHLRWGTPSENMRDKAIDKMWIRQKKFNEVFKLFMAAVASGDRRTWPEFTKGSLE